MFLAQGVFAQQSVQVVIDGDRYYCSQDSSEGGSALCKQASSSFSQEFEACKSATNNPSYCFDKAYGKVSEKDKECPEVKVACNNTCKLATNNPSYCYDKCF